MRNAFFLLIGVLSAILLLAQEPERFHRGTPKRNEARTPDSVVVRLKAGELLHRVKRGMPPDKTTALLYDVVRHYFNRLKVDSAFFYAEQIKQYCDSFSYEPGLGLYHLAKGRGYYLKSKNNESLLQFGEAIRLFRKTRQPVCLGWTYTSLARLYERMDNSQAARQHYHYALASFTVHHSEEDAVATLFAIGRNFEQHFQLDSATHYLTKALELAEKYSHSSGILNAAGALGSAYLAAGNWPLAKNYLKKALEAKPLFADKIQLRRIWSDYAQCLLLAGEDAAAEDAFQKVRQLNSELKDAFAPMAEAQLTGLRLLVKKDYAASISPLRKAYWLGYRRFGIYLKSIAYNLGIAELKTGALDSAVHHLHESIRLSRRFRFAGEEIKASLALSEAFERLGKADSAYHYFQRYANLKDSVFTAEKEKAILELNTRYETQKKEQQINSLEAERQLLSYQIQLKNQTIQQHALLDQRKKQQLALLAQQSQIDQLQSAQKTLALQNSRQEVAKKNEALLRVMKEAELQKAIMGQQKKQTFLALALVVVILCAAAGLYYRYQQNKKLGRQLAQSLVELKAAQQQLIKAETERETEDLRVRISRDIHDEVGATLSGVALFSEIAKQKMIDHQEQDAQRYLDQIASNSKEMVEKMSDIVWTINPKNDSFERIIFKLQAFALNLCAGKGIRLHFSVEEGVNRFNPSMQSRKNIYLLAKEAINNAVKYARAENLYLLVRQEEGHVIIEVNDDGVGFHPDAASGNGIGNMKARAQELDALFSVKTAPGAGTQVRLMLPIHPVGVVAS